MENRVAAQSCTATASTNLTAKTESSTILLTYHLALKNLTKMRQKKFFYQSINQLLPRNLFVE